MFKKLIVSQITKKFHTYYGTQRVCNCILKSATLDPVLSQMNSVHTLLSCFSFYICCPFVLDVICVDGNFFSLNVVSLLQVYPPIRSLHFSSPPCMLYAPPTYILTHLYSLI